MCLLWIKLVPVRDLSLPREANKYKTHDTAVTRDSPLPHLSLRPVALHEPRAVGGQVALVALLDLEDGVDVDGLQSGDVRGLSSSSPGMQS